MKYSYNFVLSSLEDKTKLLKFLSNFKINSCVFFDTEIICKINIYDNLWNRNSWVNFRKVISKNRNYIFLEKNIICFFWKKIRYCCNIFFILERKFIYRITNSIIAQVHIFQNYHYLFVKILNHYSQADFFLQFQNNFEYKNSRLYQLLE